MALVGVNSLRFTVCHGQVWDFALYLCADVANPNKAHTGRTASTIPITHIKNLIEFYKSYSGKMKDLLNMNVL